MKKKSFTLEEYVPGGRFLLRSFNRDRKVLEARFKQFTMVYLAAFVEQLEKVDTLESTVLKSKEKEEVTKELYSRTNETTKELEYFAFYLKRAKMDVKILSGVRKDLKNGNVEGACKKLEDLVQYAKLYHVALEAKGLPEKYDEDLMKKKDILSGLNTRQNEFINARKKLTAANKGQYAALYAYISEIAEAGKIYFDGEKEEDEYIISKIISKLRSPNQGGDDDKKDVTE